MEIKVTDLLLSYLVDELNSISRGYKCYTCETTLRLERTWKSTLVYKGEFGVAVNLRLKCPKCGETHDVLLIETERGNIYRVVKPFIK